MARALVKKLYVVTHPEATHHLDDLVGGQHDSDLTPRGATQAAAIAARLTDLVPRDVEVELYTSDLLRTRRTADAIGTALGVEPVAVPDLREKSYGVAGGRPQAWLDERFVPPPATGERLHHDEGVEGAETKAELAVRVYRAVEGIVARPCVHQVVVTHGMALTFVVAAWIRMPLESTGYVSFAASSGGITVLEEDEYWHNRRVAVLNDTAHLAE